MVARSTLSPFIVVRVEGSTPGVAANYAEHREEIRTALAADQAQELMATAVAAFEDARSGGATLQEAARQSGLATVTLPPVEAQGHDQRGQPVEAVAGLQDILTTAFATQEGEATDFQSGGDDTDVLAGVDRIIPQSVRPLADVRADIIQGWICRERLTRLRELAETMTTALSGGQSLTAVANANHARVVAASREVDRRTAAQTLPQGLADQLFGAAQGTPIHLVGDAGILVAVVDRINRADITAANPQMLEAIRVYAERPCQQEALQAGAPPFCGTTESVYEVLQTEIVADAHPRRNDSVLDSVFRPTNAPEEAAQQ